MSRGVEAAFVEEEVEAASVGKGSVAVGEVADNVEADLVVLSTAGGRRGAAQTEGARSHGRLSRRPSLACAAAGQPPVRDLLGVDMPRHARLPAAAAVHEKHVDANLLAEFVPCPVLLLP